MTKLRRKCSNDFRQKCARIGISKFGRKSGLSFNDLAFHGYMKLTDNDRFLDALEQERLPPEPEEGDSK